MTKSVVGSEDLRDWFVKQETALFKYRFEQESLEEKRNFLRHLNLNWKIVSALFYRLERISC